MKALRLFWIPITVALLGYGFYQAIYVAPTEATMGEIQRIFYYHVPSAMVSFLFFFASFVASILYLVSRRQHPSRALAADAIALATAEVGVVFCTVVLITGPLWARPVWGIWWTWDARLTTTLVLWLVYVSYLLLRRFAAGPQMQTLAAVLAIFGYVDVPIVYMSTTWWRTQHPGAGNWRRRRLACSGHVDRLVVERAGVAGMGHPDRGHSLCRGTPQAASGAACCPARTG